MPHFNVLESFRLQGKIALITGGARGLGLTMATALAEAGADVALAGRSRDACEASAAKISAETGRRAMAFGADVTLAVDVDRLITDIESQLGPVDIVVNSAGINIRGTADQLPEVDWDTVLNLNLK